MTFPGNLHHYFSGFIPDDQWKVPFSLAVCLHVLVLVLSLLPASLFYTRPELPEIVTIDLFTVEELKQPKAKPTKPKPQKRKPPKAPEPVKPIKKAPPPPPPPPKKPVTSIASEPPPVVPEASAKVVSLRPRKMKKKTTPPKVVKPKVRDDRRLKALERIQAKLRQEKEAKQTKHNLARLRESLHIKKEEPSPQPQPEPVSEPTSSATEEQPAQQPEEAAPSSGSHSQSKGNTELMDMALKSYYSAISSKINEYWILPEMQKWEDALEARYVIVINRNGIITKNFFEKKSGNIYFDQFVEKTMQLAAPMPHFPADIKDKSMEIGLRFRPSGLQ